MRRHLQFILSGACAECIEMLRRRWDPVMAARAPAHISLAYPEEYDDESLLITRALDAARCTAPFAVTFTEIFGEDAGHGGVWFPVVDTSKTWSHLRTAILSAPFQKLPIAPHTTVVHPRTSSRGAAALAELSGAGVVGHALLSEFVYTETDSAKMRVLERFPLLGSVPSGSSAL